ncbi:MAG TPA: DUF2238 domain-containing protein [Candidatus Paceibacterota bacterium]|nr:DUF2238 domain-containing protein [Candidatus Paceibacterota bacterium]
MQFIRTSLSNLTLSRLLPLLFMLLYIAIAAMYFSSVGNNEFLGYVVVLVVLIVLGGCVLSHQCVPGWILWLLSSVGLLHLLGAAVMVGGDILYNYVPYYIDNPTGLTVIKFDQIVHTYASGVASVLAFFFLRRDTSFHAFGLFMFAVLASMGVGAINEIIEFVAKLTVPDSDVGGYYNTAMDLSVNLVGAIVGAVVCVAFWKRPKA